MDFSSLLSGFGSPGSAGGGTGVQSKEFGSSSADSRVDASRSGGATVNFGDSSSLIVVAALAAVGAFFWLATRK